MTADFKPKFISKAHSRVRAKRKKHDFGISGRKSFQIFGVSGNLEIDFSIDLNKCLGTAIDILEVTLYFC